MKNKEPSALDIVEVWTRQLLRLQYFRVAERLLVLHAEDVNYLCHISFAKW